jgi:pimeloyl-ACP methyl ester carboxylesterase
MLPPGTEGGRMGHHHAEARFLTRLMADGVDVQPLALPDAPDAAALVLKPKTGICRQTVVISHGGGNDRLYGLWYLVEHLLERGYAIVTGHQPGHGRGGRDHFTLSAARQRLDALVGAARDVGAMGRPPLVIGQSMGGALALDFVLRTGAVSRVALVSTPVALNLDLRLLWEFPALLQPSFRRAYRYAGLWGALPAGGPFKRRDFPVRVPGGGSYIRAFAELLQDLHLLDRCRPSGLAAPTLILHGRRDGIIPVENAWRLQEAIGDKAELRIIDDACHLDPLLHTGAVGLLLDWLDGAA